MKPRFSNKRNHALTLVEVLVVIVVLAILAVIFLGATIVILPNGHKEDVNFHVICVNNLKEIGVAYRIWQGDHGDKYPVQVSVTNGGAMELAKKGIAYVNFQVMSNELNTPKNLICPSDINRFIATNFTTDFNNSNVSYLVGVDAAADYPQRILSGDDNFDIGGVPVKSGLLEFSTNAPISWTAARHKFRGNICLADGSVHQMNTNELQQALQQTGLATNRMAIP